MHRERISDTIPVLILSFCFSVFKELKQEVRIPVRILKIIMIKISIIYHFLGCYQRRLDHKREITLFLCLQENAAEADLPAVRDMRSGRDLDTNFCPGRQRRRTTAVVLCNFRPKRRRIDVTRGDQLKELGERGGEPRLVKRGVFGACGCFAPYLWGSTHSSCLYSMFVVILTKLNKP